MRSGDPDVRHLGDGRFVLRSASYYDRHVRAHRARPASSAARTAKYDCQSTRRVRQGLPRRTAALRVAGRPRADLEHRSQRRDGGPSRDAVLVVC